MTSVHFEAEPGGEGASPLTVPRPVGRMMVALALLAVIVAAVSAARGSAKAPPALGAVGASRLLAVVDRPGGGVIIRDAVNSQVLAELPADTSTFIRTLVRAVTGGRRVDATAKGVEVLLELREDGQLTVRQPGSSVVASANAFGQTQAASLYRFLTLRDAGVAAGSDTRLPEGVRR